MAVADPGAGPIRWRNKRAPGENARAVRQAAAFVSRSLTERRTDADFMLRLLFRSTRSGLSCSPSTRCWRWRCSARSPIRPLSVLMPVRAGTMLGGFRYALSRGAWRGLRDGGVRALDRHLRLRGVDLHQVSHLCPHPDRAGRLLEDAGRLRTQGALRNHRPRVSCRSTGSSGRMRATRNMTARANGSRSTLRVMCWFIFLVGHIVNNVRGFGS